MTANVCQIDVDRSAADVFAYATDPSRFGEWQHGVIDGHVEGGSDTVQVGTRCITTRRVGITRRAFTSVVTEIAPPQHWSIRGIDGPVRAMVDVAVEPMTERSSRLTIAIDFVGHGIGRVLVPLIVQREARKEMPENLARLKANLESGSR